MRGTTTDPAAILGQLAQVSTQIHAAGSPNAILELIAHQAREIIGAHQAIAGLTMDEAWARGTQAVSLSEKYAQWRRLVESSAGTALYSQMCRQNRSIRLTQAELETHPVWKDFGHERRLSMRGWLAAPLISRYGRKLGLIQLSDKYDGEFMPEDEAILVQLAHMAAIAIENVRLLEAARAAERRFLDFAEIASDWLWEMDTQFRFTYLSEGRQHAFPCLIDKVIGRTRWEVAGAHLSDPKWRHHMADLKAHRPFRNFEYTTQDGSGRLRHVSVSGSPCFDAQGRFCGYRGSGTDITRQRELERTVREQEEQFRRIVETAYEGIWVLDADARTTYVNRRTAEMLGYTVEEILGRPLLGFMDEASRAEFSRKWDTQRQSVGVQYEICLHRKDGSKLWAIVSVTPNFDDEGRFCGSLGMLTDITARKCIEERLRERDERHRAALQASSTGTYRWDIRSDKLYENKSLRRLLGLPIDEAGRNLDTFLESVHPEDRAAVAAVTRQCVRESTDLSIDYRIVRPDGTIRWLAERGQLFRDPAGEPLYMTGACTDLTDRKTLEAALREREASFRLLFEGSPIPIWVCDRESLRFLEVNETALAQYGYSREQFLAMTVLDIRPEGDHAQERAMIREMQPSPSRFGIWRHLKADGTEILVEIAAHAIDHEGRAAALACAVNVTDRVAAEAAVRHSEAAMRRLAQERTATLDALPAHVALVASHGVILSVNKAWRVFAAGNGFIGKDAGVGMNYLSVCEAASGPGGEEAALAAAGLRAVLSGAREDFALEYSCHAPAEQRWFRLMVTPIAHGSGQGAVVMHVDITAGRLARDEMVIARERAEAANRTKTEFLTNMSHELRTPLNAIIGFSEVLRAGYAGELTPKQSDYVGDIHSSGTHLLNIVNDILDLSKVEIGRLELSPGPVDLQEVTKMCMALVRARAQEAGLSLIVEIPDGLPPIWGDKVRVKQILLNLLSNAIKFTPEGGKVCMTAMQHDANVTIVVCDTGIGMRREDIAVALQPFQQVDSSLARQYEGTGLGLPLAKSLVELHGGHLRIDSTLGAGTSVAVTLPRSSTPGIDLQG